MRLDDAFRLAERDTAGVGCQLLLKVCQGNAKQPYSLFTGTEHQRGSGRHQAVVDIHYAGYCLHHLLCTHCKALQGGVVVAQQFHFDGFRGAHQVAQQIRDALPEVDGHDGHRLRDAVAQVADDFGGRLLPILLQLDEVVAEVRGRVLNDMPSAVRLE